MNKKVDISEIICTFLFILFLYTAFSQILEMNRLCYWISRGHILRDYSRPLAYGLVALEFVVGFLLMVPKYRYPGLIAVFLLFAAYNGYVIAVLFNNRHLPIKFDGVFRGISWYQQIFLNLGLIVLAFWAFTLTPARRMQQPLFYPDESSDI
jgi:FtsH-binding integral membrane protein